MYPNRTAVWRASIDFAQAVAEMDFDDANRILDELFEQMPEILR